MAANWSQIALWVLVFAIVAVIVFMLFAPFGSAVKTSGAGGGCNLYCAIKDMSGPFGQDVFPRMCGC